MLWIAVNDIVKLIIVVLVVVVVTLLIIGLLKKKVKILQQKLRRKEHKIKSMEDIITDLKNKNMITSDAATVLDAGGVIGT